MLVDILKNVTQEWLVWREGKTYHCITSSWEGQNKQLYTWALQDLQGLHLEASEWFDKMHYPCACYVFLEKQFSQSGVTTNNAYESTNNATLSVRHLAIIVVCCEVTAYINQQFAQRRAKWTCSMTKKLYDYELGQHTFTLQQARKVKDQVQHAQEDKMSILALVSAKPLESNADMVLVRVDGLSHTVICLCQWTIENWQICYHGLAAIFCTASAWTRRMSTDDPIWYSFPYRVTTLQKMYLPDPVLPTTSDQMEAKPIFPEQCHRKCGARKQNRYISDLSHSPQKYPCKLCGRKGHYASKCNKPQVSVG